MLHSYVHSLILNHIQQNNYVPLGIMLLTIAYVIDFESHIHGCVWLAWLLDPFPTCLCSVDREAIVLPDVVYCSLNIVGLFYASVTEQ